MKNIICFISLILMVLCGPTFAEKIIITGKPVTLEQRGTVYYAPQDYSAATNYHYVTMGGTQRVCFLEKQPSLSSLNLVMVNVNVNGQSVQWNCYPFNETYFEVTP